MWMSLVGGEKSVDRRGHLFIHIHARTHARTDINLRKLKSLPIFLFSNYWMFAENAQRDLGNCTVCFSVSIAHLEIRRCPELHKLQVKLFHDIRCVSSAIQLVTCLQLKFRLPSAKLCSQYDLHRTRNAFSQNFSQFDSYVQKWYAGDVRVWCSLVSHSQLTRPHIHVSSRSFYRVREIKCTHSAHSIRFVNEYSICVRALGECGSAHVRVVGIQSILIYI